MLPFSIPSIPSILPTSLFASSFTPSAASFTSTASHLLNTPSSSSSSSSSSSATSSPYSDDMSTNVYPSTSMFAPASSSSLNTNSSQKIDSTLLTEVWSGVIPCMFTLAPEEVTTIEEPPPFVQHIPRQGYFPLVLGAVRSHFQAFAPAREDEMWLEFQGIPIKWTLPIGVLYDLFVSAHQTSTGNQSTSLSLPWRLVVHFQSFPSKKIQRCKNQQTVKQHFLNTFKEACYMRFGNARMAMSCTPADHHKLWLGAAEGRLDAHMSIRARFPETPTHSYSVRLFVTAGDIVASEKEDTGMIDLFSCPIQRNIKPSKHGEVTLFELIRTTVPQLLDPSQQTLRAGVSIFIQGIHITHLNTPMSFLMSHFSHPDFFLYVVFMISQNILSTLLSAQTTSTSSSSTTDSLLHSRSASSSISGQHDMISSPSNIESENFSSESSSTGT